VYCTLPEYMNISLWTRQYLFLNFMTAGGGYGTLYSGQRSSCLLLIHSPQAAASLVPHNFQVQVPGASPLYRWLMPRHYQVQVSGASPLPGTVACCRATTRYRCLVPRHFQVRLPGASPLPGTGACCLTTTRYNCLLPCHFKVLLPGASPFPGTAA
jgi:hypothetical protein